MKAKMIFRTMGLLTLTASLFVFSSCTKTADGNLNNSQLDRNLEATAVDEKDFSESDEDLTSVDYKEFYDQLSPHGEWIQVDREEIGLEHKTVLNEGSGNNSFSLSSLLGINNAYASSDVNTGMVYVWKPSQELAVTSTVDAAPVYVPYSNGQWVNTDAGWYFKAPTPVEETTSHYGRWVNSPKAGWLWVPGRVWAPAWVDWRQNDKYVSWAPLPPSVYVVNNSMSTPEIDENNYVIVERKYFLEPEVYKYNNVYYENGDRIPLSEMSVIPGIVIVNSAIINRGPDVNIFQTLLGRNIELVKIQHVGFYKDVRYSDGSYFVYYPGFKRYKNKDNKFFTMNEPKHFKKYSEWKEIKSIEKEFKKEEKEDRKEFKGNDNGKKFRDDDNGKKYKDNDNGRKYNDKDKHEKYEKNDKSKNNGGNEKGNNNGKVKGNKDNNDNENGNKQNGNNNNKGKK